MRRSSLGLHLVAVTALVFCLVSLIFSCILWKLVSARVESDAAREVMAQSADTLARIEMIDRLSSAQVGAAMRVLQEESRLRGTPALKGDSSIAGARVPNLCLGNEPQVMNFSVVDKVKELAGGTATLFVWDGINFTRISTNVLKPDGSRAVGTVLDAKGKAFPALAAGRAFHGVVDILGTPYTTSYEPMFDDGGKLVGAWYTGFRLDSISALGASIQNATILDHGFMELVKPAGEVVFHGNGVPSEALDKVRTKSSDWRVNEQVYPAWGYRVITAYPESDVRSRLAKTLGLFGAGAFLLIALIIALQFVLLRRMVLAPVGDLTVHLASADLNTLLPALRHDEIGALAVSFNQYVKRLRQTLLKVRDGSAATTGKSNEIRGISHTAVSRMAEQQQHADTAARAVEQLTHDIAGISSHADDASCKARAAADAAKNGQELVASSVRLMQSLSEDTRQSAERVTQLSQRAEEIGSIVGVIEEIAAGTNLLALNASIEAARAGEHGRGFAVVAGEVRRLAERTAQATKQVSSLVDGIKSETAQTAGGIRSARERASEGGATVSSLSSTFNNIAGMVIEVDRLVEQIAQAAHQQAAAANAVSSAMQKVASTSQESASGAEQVVAATGELLETAHTLEGMVEQFHLREMPEERAA